MARRKRHNPERRAWRGRSYRKGGKVIVDLKEKLAKRDVGSVDSALADCLALSEDWEVVS